MPIRKLHKGDLLAVSAHDHNSNPSGKSTVVFVGLFLGRVVRDHRRFVELASVYYPEHDGFVGIGRSIHILEREVTEVRNLGRA